ncbi:unnamed protein product [Somion occarium]|uniref:Transmembrane protein n=1 Tax=Somion occarium TaxID=3059160 RepID=A0ABP1D8I1_9APHY
MALLLSQRSALEGLRPDVAFQAQTANYITAAIETAWLWDLFVGIPEEVRLFTEKRLTIPDLTYAVARIMTFGFLTAAVTFSVAPVDEHCHSLIKAAGWFGAISAPCNTLLFFIRIRGIFRESRIVVALFGLLWLSTCASVLAPLSFNGLDLDLVNHVCLMTDVKTFGAAGFLTITFFDTAVFIAMSIKVISFSLAETWRGKLRSFLSGKNLGYVSKALLHTGQLYYLATVGLNFFVIIVLVTPSVSSTYRATLTVPMVALQNAMACRVFRLLKFGVIQDVPSSLLSSHAPTGSQTLQFAASQSVSMDQEYAASMESHRNAEEDIMVSAAGVV